MGDCERVSLIKPNTITPITIPAPPRGRSVHEVVFYEQHEDKWKPLSSSVWPHDPKQRSLVFFYWDEKEKRIRIQSIAEVPPAKEILDPPQD